MNQFTLLLTALSFWSASAVFAAESVSYHRDIAPIFQAKCHGCHQPAKSMGEYVMTVRESLLAGGESGEPAVVPGEPDASLLMMLITPLDGTAEMPRKGEPLEPAEIELVRRWIATGAEDDTPPSTREVYNADNPPRYSRPPVITSLDVSPDGKLLAIAAFHEVRLHSADDGKLVARLIGLSERIESARFSPDGSQLAVTGGLPGRTGEIQIWDVSSRELALSLPITYDTVYGASWSPDGKAVAFGCADNTVRVIDVETGEPLFFQGSHNDWVFDTVFSADGDYLVSVGRDMTAKLSEFKTERFIDNITSITPGALKGGIASVVRHPRRDEVLFGGADGIPKIYQMHRTTKREIGDDANLLWQFPQMPGRLFGVAFTPDARHIIAGSSLDGRGTLGIFRLDPDAEIPKKVRKVLQKPTHNRGDGEQELLREHFAKHIETVAQVPLETGGIYAVAAYPDNKRVVAGGADGRVYVFDVEAGEQLDSFLPVELSDEAEVALTAEADGSADREDADHPAEESATTTAADGGASLADRVVGLHVEPSSIDFTRRSDGVQLVVTADLGDGTKADVTRFVTGQPNNPVVSVSPWGRVVPLANGQGELVLGMGDHSVVVPVSVANFDAPPSASYVRDVAPVLSRSGCNGGTCHGAQDGKNGFKLSLRGYDPITDVRSFTDDLSSRRVNLAAPDQSLMLLKSTGAVPHEGGQVVPPGSNYYDIIRSWIAGGAELDLSTPRVKKIEVFPINPVINELGAQQQMRVVATYADGLERDVTAEAFIESGNTEVAAAVPRRAGLMQAIRRGEAPVLVRYEGNYVGTTVTVMGDRAGFVWAEPPANNRIDELVAAKLRRTKTLSSPLCNDYEFVRRIHLDLTGLPPSSDVVRAFVDDPRDSRWKRDELIERLLASDAYIEHWTNKWADLLQVNGRFLGREGASRLRKWIRDRLAVNAPYDHFARDILTASGSNKENPPASYYKILRTPEETMENTTHLFLATRFNCNKCHDHPFERWTQDQYYELAAFFAHVDRKEDPASEGEMIGQTAVEEGKPLYEEIFDKNDGDVVHQRTGLVAAPKFPYQTSHDAPDDASRREELAAWITSPSNPYFATSYVNRIWGYLTGTGLIEPLDDIRAGNPPSNPELLAWLTDQFIESGFDVRKLMRTICRSRTYQLSIRSNEWNEDDTINFSHAKARRLPAEVLYDAIYAATGTVSDFPDVAPGTRAGALPDVAIELDDGFLNNLGRPPRESACECERSSQLQLGPIMALVSGPTVGKAVSDDENALAKLVAQVDGDRELVDELYMRILNRPPSAEEMDAMLATADNMEREHEQLMEELATYEVDAAKNHAAKEQQRLADLESARAQLAAYEVELAPKLAARRERRAKKIAQLKKELVDRRREALAQQTAWETEQQGGSVWTTLDPQFLRSLEGDLIITRNPDRSFTATGESVGAGYALEASTPLSDITGVRVDVLADPELPQNGPGKDSDGDFVLTELEVATRNVPQRDSVVFRQWDFANNVGGWKWNGDFDQELDDGRLRLKIGEDESGDWWVNVSAPAGGFVLEIVAKASRQIGLAARWITADAPGVIEDDDKLFKTGIVPSDDGWSRYRIFFRSETDLVKLGLTPRAVGGAELLVDSISLLRYEADEFAPVALQNPQADFSAEGHDVALAADGENKLDIGWSIGPETGLDHVAVFETTQDVAGGEDGWLRLVLSQQTDDFNRIIGRFRLSVTSSARPISLGLPQEIAEIVARPAGQRSADDTERLERYYLGQQKGLVRLKYLLAETEKPLPPDEGLVAHQAGIARLEKPTPLDAKLLRLRNHAQLSADQLGRRRLTAAQDIAWALINSPAFLYNH